MAVGTTVQITGEIRKGFWQGRKQFGVPVTYTFADGKSVDSMFTADRKKDVITALLPGGALEKKAQAAHIGPGGISFRYVLDGTGFHPDA